jgi:hypothetical protein
MLGAICEIKSPVADAAGNCLGLHIWTRIAGAINVSLPCTTMIDVHVRDLRV